MKKSQKVVVIDNVKSDLIDRAILVLRSGTTVQNKFSYSSPIVEQAQEIINGYIGKVRSVQKKSERRAKYLRRRNRVFRAAAVTASLSAVILASFASGWILNAIL